MSEIFKCPEKIKAYIYPSLIDKKDSGYKFIRKNHMIKNYDSLHIYFSTTWISIFHIVKKIIKGHP